MVEKIEGISRYNKTNALSPLARTMGYDDRNESNVVESMGFVSSISFLVCSFAPPATIIVVFAASTTSFGSTPIDSSAF